MSGCNSLMNHKSLYFCQKKIFLCWKNAIRTFKTDGERELGPREENNATSGDICRPTTVLVLLNLITGFLQQARIYHKNKTALSRC